MYNESTMYTGINTVLKETFCLFFQRSNQPSEAWKSLHPNSLAKEGFGF